jgi:hypothetical protein
MSGRRSPCFGTNCRAAGTGVFVDGVAGASAAEAEAIKANIANPEAKNRRVLVFMVWFISKR